MAAESWHPALLPYLARPHRPTWRLAIHHPDLPGGVQVLQVSRLQLSWDETRAPRVQLRADVVAPTDPAVDVLLDPRTQGLRLHVHAGHIIGGVDDRILVADLGLRVRGITQPDGTTLLDAQSDEALVMDAAPSSVFSGATPSSSTRGQIRYLIQLAIPSAPVVLAAPTDATFAIAVGDMGDKWNKIEDLADSLGDVDVYDDGLRLWWVTPRPTLAATPDLVLRDGADGTVVQTASTTDRDGFANRVLLIYRWTPSGGTEQVIQAVRSVTTGPHAAGTNNVKTWTEERTTSATQAKADAAATSLLRRKASMGRVHTVRAVSVPWLRPGHTVQVTTRTGTARYLVSSVTFDGAGWMELTTRYPDSTMTIGA